MFIQLIITHKIRSSFISETEEGARGQDSRERAREREQALGRGGYSVSCKPTIRKYTCLINQMVNIWKQFLLISKMRNLSNDVSHVRSILTAKIFESMTTQHFLTSVVNEVGMNSARQ
jgi:hypothetical protein